MEVILTGRGLDRFDTDATTLAADARTLRLMVLATREHLRWTTRSMPHASVALPPYAHRPLQCATGAGYSPVLEGNCGSLRTAAPRPTRCRRSPPSSEQRSSRPVDPHLTSMLWWELHDRASSTFGEQTVLMCPVPQGNRDFTQPKLSHLVT